MDESFLKEETRCGFVVTTERKKIWAVELDLLRKFDEVCMKHKINYFAVSGTLLGAVRHKGFIPWDDDVDVGMTRDDYDRLCLVAKDEFKEPYFFQNGETDTSYFIGYAMLRNSKTTGIISFLSDHRFNNGIDIDIFIFDRIPKRRIKLKKQLFWAKFYSGLLNNYYFYNSKKNNFLQKSVIYFARAFCKREKLLKKYLEVCTRYNEDESLDVISRVCAPEAIFAISSYKQSHLTDRVPFENIMINIPKDYELTLRANYGDYMELPPVSERGKHHDNILTFDPDVPFIEYYKKHPEQFSEALKEYEKDDHN